MKSLGDYLKSRPEQSSGLPQSESDLRQQFALTAINRRARAWLNELESYMKSEDFYTILEDPDLSPTNSETEEEYVNRIKGRLREILYERFVDAWDRA